MADPDASFLRAFHARHPGVTARALGRARTADGRSSYALVGAGVPPAARVLDVGCGDGFLLEWLARGAPARRPAVGVDLSSSELGAARMRLGPTGALVHAHAAALPFEAASFDVILAHLFLPLATPIEGVLVELGRVLRPAGQLRAVVGGGPVAGTEDAFALLLRLAEAQDGGRLPRAPRLGDARARTTAGLESLLRGAGSFSDGGTSERHTLILDGSPEEVWQSLVPCYDLATWPDDELALLRRSWEREIASRPGWARLVPCRMAVRLIAAPRRSAG